MMKCFIRLGVVADITEDQRARFVTGETTPDELKDMLMSGSVILTGDSYAPLEQDVFIDYDGPITHEPTWDMDAATIIIKP